MMQGLGCCRRRTDRQVTAPPAVLAPGVPPLRRHTRIPSRHEVRLEVTMDAPRASSAEAVRTPAARVSRAPSIPRLSERRLECSSRCISEPSRPSTGTRASRSSESSPRCSSSDEPGPRGDAFCMLEQGMTVRAMFRMKDKAAHFRLDADDAADTETTCTTECSPRRRYSSTSVSSSSLAEQYEALDADFHCLDRACLEEVVRDHHRGHACPVSVSLDKRRGPIGVVVGSSCGILRVSKVIGGLMEEWNNLHPESTVSAGDRILEINGVRGNDIAMLRELARGPDNVRLLVTQGLSS